MTTEVGPRGDPGSLRSPRRGERCMLCNALEPSSHALVCLDDNLHFGVVCASHTLRELVLSGQVYLEIRYAPECEPTGWTDPIRLLANAAVRWWHNPLSRKTQDQLKVAVQVFVGDNENEEDEQDSAGKTRADGL